MVETNVNVLQGLINTVKRGLDRVENNQCHDLEDLYKTLKVMASVCDQAATNVKAVIQLS